MHEMAKKRVVLSLPGMGGVPVRGGIEYAPGRTLDIHGRGPAVLFVSGYPDEAFAARMGCAVLDMAGYVSWAELVGVSGMAAVRYRNREPADVHLVVRHLREHAAELGIDGARIGVMACSGNGPTALDLLARERLRCAALSYAYMYGYEPVTPPLGFARPGGTIDDLPSNLPVHVVRCGKDELPGLNASIDAFAAAALARNMPVTVANLPDAPHAFDLLDDSDASRTMIRRTLEWLRFELQA